MCVLQLALACSLVLASFLALVLVRFLVLVPVFVLSTCSGTRSCSRSYFHLYFFSCSYLHSYLCAFAPAKRFRAPGRTRNPRARTRTTTLMFTRWTAGAIERTRRDPQRRTHHLFRALYLVALGRSSLFAGGGERSSYGCSLRFSSVELRRSPLPPSCFGRFHSHFDGQWPGSQVWIWDS